MNTPNKLSMVRIVIVPVILLFLLPIRFLSFEPEGWNTFILTQGRLIACVLFIIASITDYVDGYIARKYDLVTNLGKFLDALADKMLVISVLVALVQIQRLSSFGVVLIILREFMVSGIRMIASADGNVIAAKMIGKVKTVTQMIAIIYILLETLLIDLLPRFQESHVYISIIGDVLFWGCVVMTVVSGMDYLLKNVSYFRENN